MVQQLWTRLSFVASVLLVGFAVGSVGLIPNATYAAVTDSSVATQATGTRSFFGSGPTYDEALWSANISRINYARANNVSCPIVSISEQRTIRGWTVTMVANCR